MQKLFITTIFFSLALWLLAIAISRWHKLICELRDEHARNRAKQSKPTIPLTEFWSLKERQEYEQAWKDYLKQSLIT